MQSEIKTLRIDEGQSQLFSGMQEENHICFAGRADQGGRAQQQDYILLEQQGEYLLAVVCDGMGGMEGGAQASRMAAEMMKQIFLQEGMEDPRKFFSDCAARIDMAVYALEENGKRMQAGTTMVAALLQGRRLHWLSVGDSRIYLYREGQILCPVPAHNYWLLLQEMLASGKIDRQQYIREGSRSNASGLISYLGIGGLPRMEMNTRAFEAQPGDMVLLCSDGLFKSLSDEEILDVIEEQIPAEEKVDMLISAALERGGAAQDNTSAILVEIG